MTPTFKAPLLVALILVSLGGCKPKRRALAVGSEINRGSMLFGRANCTYEAPPSVAVLNSDRSNGRLVGPGEVIQDCRGTRSALDVLVPTGARIEGPASIAVGAADHERFSVVLLAGNRPLETGGHPVQWTLGPDCTGVATARQNPGAQDTGRNDTDLWLDARGRGRCTVTGSVLGRHASRTVQIR